MLRNPRKFQHLTHATVPGFEEPIPRHDPWVEIGLQFVAGSRPIDCEGEGKDTSESAVDPSAWLQRATCC